MNNKGLLSVGSEVQGLEGTYSVVGVLTGGAYAQVYRVQDQNGNSAILKLTDSSRPDESTILTRVSHALSIEGLRDRTSVFIDRVSGEFGNRHGHIEKEAAGRSLRGIQLSEQEVIQVAIEFAKVLQACARHHIAYLDIKMLDHVFWDQDSKRVTIIDWNVAKTDASLSDLRNDVWNFCEHLVELFTGHSQDDLEKRLHPLGWSMMNMEYGKARRISYATWCILAQTSLCWGNPLLHELRDLLQVPTLSALRERTDDKEGKLVENAWSAIIGELQWIAELWADPAGKESSTQGAVTNVPTYFSVDLTEQYIQELKRLSVRVLKNSSNLSLSQEWAPEVVHRAIWLAREGQESFQRSILTLRQGAWAEHERPLRAIRLLNSQDTRAALVWSAYAIWDRVGAVDETWEMTWKELIQALVGQNVVGVRDWLDEREGPIRESLENVCRERALDDLWNIYSHAFDQLVKEARAWTWLETAKGKQKEGEGDKALKCVEEALKNVPYHPLASPIKQKAEAAKERRERVNEAYKNLQGALSWGDGDVAQEALRTLKDAQEQDAQAQEWVERYENPVQTLVLVSKALTSWDKEDLDRALQALYGSRANTVPLPSETDKLLVDRIRKRRDCLESMEKDLSELHDRLPKVPAGKLPDLEEQAEILQSVDGELKKLAEKYEDAPQITGVRKEWLSKAKTIMQVAVLLAQKQIKAVQSNSDSDLDVRQKQIKGVLKFVNSLLLSIWPAYCDAQETSAVPAVPVQPPDEWITKLEQAQKKVKDRYNELKNAFEQSLQKEPKDFAGLYEELEGLPDSLQRDFEPRVKEAWQTYTINGIKQALTGNIDDAIRLIDAVKPPVDSWHDDDFGRELEELKQEAERKILVQKAEELLKSPNDSQWVETAKEALKSLQDSGSAETGSAEVANRLKARIEELDWQKRVEESVKVAKEEIENLKQEHTAIKEQLGDIHESIVLPEPDHTQTWSEEMADTKKGNVVPVAQQIADLQDTLQNQGKALENRLMNMRMIGGGGLLLNFLMLLAVLWMAWNIRGNMPQTRGSVEVLPTQLPTKTAMNPITPQSSVPQTPSAVEVIPSSTAIPSHTPVPNVSPTSMEVNPVAATPTQGAQPAVTNATAENAAPEATPWPIGTRLQVIDPQGMVFRDQQLTRPLWQYAFRGNDQNGKEITATVITIAEPTGQVIQVEAEFVVYVVNTENLKRVKKGAYLRSQTQRAHEGRYPSIQALLAMMQDTEDVSNDMILDGPTPESQVGSWIKLRLHGWIPIASVQPVVNKQ